MGIKIRHHSFTTRLHRTKRNDTRHSILNFVPLTVHLDRCNMHLYKQPSTFSRMSSSMGFMLLTVFVFVHNNKFVLNEF